MSVDLGLAALRDAGLVFQASIPVSDLPKWADEPMRAVGIDPGRYQCLVMLGQGGSGLWDYIVAQGSRGPDPFDEASKGLAAEFVTSYLDGAPWEIVYPGGALLPLSRLAELVGWGAASPLGLTINDRYGLWLAHRIVFLVDADVPIPPYAEFAHPCDSCVDKPCVTACPVGAVDATSGFAIELCAPHRIKVDSQCALQCLARNACPVGAEHRYGPDQMAHHYGSGLASIRAYYESDASS